MMAALAVGIAAGNIFETGTLDPELFRRDFIGANVSVAYFRDAGRARDGDFVQTVQSVDHQSAMRAQHAERFRQLFHQFERNTRRLPAPKLAPDW